jgi:hypothetical protein
VALIGKFFGRTASEGAAYAFGVATGPVLAPATETIRQAAWEVYAARIPGVASLAAGVAQGQVDEGTARAWAKKQGFDKEAFDALVDIANTGPDVGMAMQAWRRGKLTEAGFRTVLKRHAIEDRWTDAIEALKTELLGPADLARAIHRGLIPDPGLLQGELPRGVGNVPAYPVYDVDALAEAAGSGFDRDRLGVLVGLQGNPMGAHEAAQAEFRGVLTHDDYLRAIAEGNTRNEWAEAIREQSRSIPSAANYVAAFIRGWRTKAQAYAGAARHGMTKDDVDLLALIAGRPVTTRQAFLGFIRGGRVDGESWNERETFRRAVIQSNIRPEWEPILWAQRYSYPSAFVLRAMVQSGDITQAEGEEVLLFQGWEPTFAKKVAAAWASGGATKADSHIGKAQTQLWTTTHRSYLAGEITKTVARNALGQAGVAAASVATVLGTWDAEKALIRAQLSAANVKKAFNKGGRNNATGKPWTRDEALAALIELGWAALAANDYLDIP